MANKPPFKIAGHHIAAGTRLRFDLQSAQLYTNTPLNMSVEVINGRRPGPTLLVCAALHGDELNGTEIIRRLRSVRALERLRGTLVLVPVVNLLGFIHRSRYLPDRRDLNRCFPGSDRGSLGARLANLFFEEVVCRCEAVIDLHTAAIHRDNLPQIRADLTVPGVERMAKGFSIPTIINSGIIPNSLRGEACSRGIPVITYEAGEALRLDENAIVTGVRGVVNVMRALGMLAPGRSRMVRAEPYIARASSWERAPVDGIFQTSARLGSRVEQGQQLGVISSPIGADDTSVISRFEGILVGVNRLPLVNQGDALFHVARFSEASAVEEEIGTHESNIEADPLYEVLDANS